jgi:polysaccharide biosynthesis transport protein
MAKKPVYYVPPEPLELASDHPTPYIVIPQQQSWSDSGDSSISDLLRSLWRHRLLILVVMFVCGVVAFIVARQMPERYIAQGVMSVETRQIAMPGIGSFMMPGAVDTTSTRSDAQIIKSRAMADTVAGRLKLTLDPEFNPALREYSTFERVVTEVKHQIIEAGRAVGVIPPAPIGLNLSEEQRARDAAVQTLLRNLEIRTDGRSYVIYVEYDSLAPETASNVVNAIMESFVAWQIESSTKTMVETNNWLNERMNELRREVQAADQKVQEYRSNFSLVETRAGTVSAQQLNELNTQLSLARAARAEAEARYNRAQEEAKTRGSAASASDVLASSLIARLRERETEAMQRESEIALRLGPTHPQRAAIRKELSDLRAQLDREIGKVLSSLGSQADVARAREVALDRQLQQLHGRAGKVAETEVELRQLEKEAEAKRSVYQAFLVGAQQTSRPPTNQNSSRIVSTAVAPLYPSSPRVSLYVAASMMAGMLFAGAGILFRAQIDRGFSTLSDVENATGLPALGVLPKLKAWRRSERSLPRFVLRHPDSPISETVRGIRASLRHVSRGERPQVVLVTSAEAGEGKTSVACAIGCLAALDGLSVLLIDSDLRRPQLHKLFGTKSDANFKDVLSGSRAWVDSIRVDPRSGVHYLGAIDSGPNPIQLLDSDQWSVILEQARKVYDLIVLDSPPLLRVADGLTLAERADAVLLVVSQEETKRSMVNESIRRLSKTETPIAGIVLSNASGRVSREQYYAGRAA